MQNEFIFTHAVEVAGSLSGVVTVPTDFDPAKESLPVIVFLHGSGERGTNPEIVKVHAVPKLFSADPDYHGLRVITLSPQCPEGMIWHHISFPLKTWIDAAVDQLNGDRKRISVTGLSMGGYGAWDMIMSFPEYFSCCAPVCGGGVSWRAHRLPGKKLRVFHGLDDDVVPFACSMEMVEAARRHGADVEFTAYDKVGHGSWIPAYEQTDLIEWLVSQSL